jgi:peptidoglycan/LPS O-acetylase OafA/YrhL
MFSHAAWITVGKGIPVPEAAASHWFTWALGAIAVEAAFGLVKLPAWCRNVWLGGAAIVLASATSMILPVTQKDTLPHDLAWLLMHPAWGVGFFIIVNRVVQAEQRWLTIVKKPGGLSRALMRMVAATAFVGVFSYSLYLTHELVIMQSWWFVSTRLPPILNTLLIVVPATVAFAWVFYRFCEKPFMTKTAKKVERIEEPRAEELVPVFAQTLPAVADEA